MKNWAVYTQDTEGLDVIVCICRCETPAEAMAYVVTTYAYEQGQKYWSTEISESAASKFNEMQNAFGKQMADIMKGPL